TGACARAAATTSPIVSASLNTGTTTIGTNAARPLLRSEGASAAPSETSPSAGLRGQSPRSNSGDFDVALDIVGGLIQVRSGSVPHLAFPSTAGREAATHSGWPDKGAAWLRTTIATWLPPRAIAWTSAGPREELSRTDAATASAPRPEWRPTLDPSAVCGGRAGRSDASRSACSQRSRGPSPLAEIQTRPRSPGAAPASSSAAAIARESVPRPTL